MINPNNPEEFGPGLARCAYLDQLADTGHTGWHDERGTPAPWPEDFCDPDSGWELSTGGDITNNNPNQPF